MTTGRINQVTILAQSSAKKHWPGKPSRRKAELVNTGRRIKKLIPQPTEHPRASLQTGLRQAIQLPPLSSHKVGPRTENNKSPQRFL